MVDTPPAVPIKLQTITGKRVELQVEPCIDAKQLRQLVGEQLGWQDPSVIKLVCQGQALPRAGALQLKAGSIILATPERKVPPAHVREAVLSAGSRPAGEEEDKFAVPADARPWEKALAGWLKSQLGCPDLLLEWLFLVKPFNVLLLLGCVALAPVAARFDLGPVFILTCLVAAIFSNLGQRRAGEASAYSIFNPGVQRLPGQLDADDVAEQIRRGQI